MSTQSSIVTITHAFNEKELQKGVYLVVIHATRTPPHIGLIIGGYYHSLSVKGHDINTSITALIKNSTQRQIPSLFIKIKAHATFSESYQKEHFISNIKQFPKVDIGVATCLSPIKLFFNEVYNVSLKNINYLFELLPLLYSELLIETTSALFIDEQQFALPIYTQAEINKGIQEVKNLTTSLKQHS
ncbi:MAG: hypothetical protein WBM13_02880 [Bacteroidia bacterium]